MEQGCVIPIENLPFFEFVSKIKKISEGAQGSAIIVSYLRCLKSVKLHILRRGS